MNKEEKLNHYKAIEKNINSIIDILKLNLTKNEYIEFYMFFQNAEYGLAIDTIKASQSYEKIIKNDTDSVLIRLTSLLEK